MTTKLRFPEMEEGATKLSCVHAFNCGSIRCINCFLSMWSGSGAYNDPTRKEIFKAYNALRKVYEEIDDE